ncbi:HD-GYP domain-containing protein [Desulfotruncus alcoholivorax]|uniref:HD-GYP domain-containing protein n=1 Tax=Desulfotruncus alcoholivorax TaxID=265477 RepID=UPI0004144B12|nr:HD domain-containing protein [Desulfotruncus alcoholivorax]
MADQLKIQLYKLLSAFSLAMDYNRHGLMRHHQRVALLALYLAEELQLSGEEYLPLFCSAIIHDAGSSTFREKANLEHFEVNNPWEHCERGFNLLDSVRILKPLAGIVRHHHDNWDGQNFSGLSGNLIPLASRIIYLADRVDILAQKPGNILDHRDEIVEKIQSKSGTMFDPGLVEAFSHIAQKECLWLDLTNQFIQSRLEQNLGNCPVTVNQDEITGISLIFSKIIDGKSPFTFRHSQLVAEVARFLAEKIGFDKEQQNNMYIAGLLHDLGKLSIPDEILEKPGRLNKVEYNVIKQHTYITYQILSNIDCFEEINSWASYHHEKLDGTGYPFHLTGKELTTGSRVMAVADIFSALIEDRPYRQGMSRNEIEKILVGQVKSRAIDGEIAGLLLDSYGEAEDLKEKIHGREEL